MRPAELYRRSILLPKDSVALVRLEAQDVEPSTAVERLAIADNHWPHIWPLINDLNRVCGTDLHDHDTAPVDVDQLPLLIDHLRTRRYTHPIAKDFAHALAALSDQAEQRRMPLFFVL